MYDITDEVSFASVKTWLNEIDRYASESVDKLLVGNKCDLEEERAVPVEQAKEFADSLKVNFIETSAKASSNVDTAFLNMSTTIMKRLAAAPKTERTKGQRLTSMNRFKEKQNKKCC